jgi:glutathione peroxidase
MSKFFKIFILLIFMFNFFSSASANYKKLAYDFSFKDNNEQDYSLDQYKGKVILVVNVASRCGFTKQYADLQKLYDENKSKGLIIIGVPSNDFGNQEPGSNKEIKKFCETNFGITFPIMAKTTILGDTGHPFYKWVEENYGKSGVPKWNFYKVLINKTGKIEEVYSSITNPSSKKIKNRINSILQ